MRNAVSQYNWIASMEVTKLKSYKRMVGAKRRKVVELGVGGDATDSSSGVETSGSAGEDTCDTMGDLEAGSVAIRCLG